MSRLMALLLLFCYLPVFAQDKDEAVRKELARLQGEWKLTGGQAGGEAFPADMIIGASIIIKDKVYDFKTKDESEKGVVQIDPSKSPAQIDLTITEGKDKGQKQLGIYEITGNKLRICASLAGVEKRPEKIVSNADNMFLIFEFEQVKK